MSWSTLALILLSLPVGAVEIKGYSPKPEKTMEFNEAIERIEDAGDRFMVLFAHHPAFYALPKGSSDDSILREIKSVVKQKKSVHAEIDPIKARILKLKWN